MSLFKDLMTFLRFPTDAPPTPEESRAAPRVRCRYKVRVKRGEDDFAGEVIDLSTSGMRLEIARSVSPGNRLGLIRADDESGEAQGEPVYGLAVWCRRRPHDDVLLAGLRFSESKEEVARSWVGPLLKELGLDESVSNTRRKWVRLPTALRAELRDLETGEYLAEGAVQNLSMGGALVQSNYRVRKGTDVLALFGPFSNYPFASLPAKVVMDREHPVEEAYLHSIEFSDTSSSDYRTMERYLQNLLTDRSLV